METLWKWSEGGRRLLYLATPNETSFQTVQEVPQYLTEAVPYFTALILLEIFILSIQGKPLPRANDALSSISAGLMSMLHGILFRAIEMMCYVWVFEHFNVISLPWNSPWTWVLGFLGVDFGYYWVHRCGHEVNIMWAGHQAHHSSEDYNLTTALRQSAIFRYVTWVFYLPMALFVPPAIFCVHNQFNLLYQFWIHTETIDNLGPLEYIINTPSHHRVHHGRNPYCIDKNYGGTLIIWDRIFGTFQQEDEKVEYGLVHPLATWEPIYTQLCHLIHIIKMTWKRPGFCNKLSTILKGPGWMPGTPRLGWKEDLPEIEYPVVKYDRSLSYSLSVYVWTNFALTVIGYLRLASYGKDYSTDYNVFCVAYIIFSLSTFGLLYDHWKWSPVMEVIRCFLFLVGCHVLDTPRSLEFSPLTVVYLVHLVAGLLWIAHIWQQWKIIKMTSSPLKKKDVE